MLATQKEDAEYLAHAVLAGALRPLIAALRDAVSAAKDQWMRLCSGRREAMEPFRVAAGQIAQGADAIAARIRAVAEEHAVPIVENPPLARALYAHCELEQQIPATLYTVVAEVMAWVFQLNHWIAEGGLPPDVPSQLAVPDGMDPGSGEAPSWTMALGSSAPAVTTPRGRAYLKLRLSTSMPLASSAEARVSPA